MSSSTIKFLKTTWWLVLQICFASVSLAQDIPSRPEPPRLVNDLANVFSSKQADALERMLVDYDDSTSIQIVVVTVRSLGNWDAEEFAHTIGDKWGVGQKGKDNGIVILLAMESHDIWISTGRGSEGALPDITAKHIIEQDMIPRFRQNDFFGGTVEGVKSIQKVMAGEYDAEPAKRKDERGNSVLFWIIVLIVIMLFIFRNRNRGRRGYIGRRGFNPFWPIFWGSMMSGGGGRGWGGGGGFGSGGFGGFGGGSFGGGGAGGRW